MHDILGLSSPSGNPLKMLSLVSGLTILPLSSSLEAQVKSGTRSQNSLMMLCYARLSLTLCDPMDCSPTGSSVQGISQARVLEWVAISFSRGSSWPRNWTCVSCIAGKFFTHFSPQGSPHCWYGQLVLMVIVRRGRREERKKHLFF